MRRRGIAFSKKTPLFIDSQGQAFLRKRGRSLKWGDFARLAKLPKVTSMTFRHNMSKVLSAQKDASLAEMEKFTHCHSEATRQKHNADEVANRAISLIGQDWYIR